MKKYVAGIGMVALGAFCLLVASGADDKAALPYKGPTAPFAQAIGATAVKVLPDRNAINVPAFAAGTAYTQGAVVSSGAFWYMCVFTNASGTAGTNSPHHASGEASDGTNTWRRIQSGPRKGLILYNGGTNSLHIGAGYVPTAATGPVILSGGHWYEDQGIVQAAVYVIGEGTATNGLITGIEL